MNIPQPYRLWFKQYLIFSMTSGFILLKTKLRFLQYSLNFYEGRQSIVHYFLKNLNKYWKQWYGSIIVKICDNTCFENGITLSSFINVGNCPSAKDLLKITTNIGAITEAAILISLVGKLAGPDALFSSSWSSSVITSRMFVGFIVNWAPIREPMNEVGDMGVSGIVLSVFFPTFTKNH